MPEQQRSPRPVKAEAPKSSTAANEILPGFTVRGLVRLDLRGRASALAFDDAVLIRQVQMLAYAPPGADVVVQVAAGQFVPSLAVSFLRAEGRHLGSVTVESSDPPTVRRWVLALRGEEAITW
jgi:hypothetical protein